MPENLESPQFNRVAVIGVGLIGGSIGLGLLNRKLANSVIGIGRNLDRLEKAKDLGAITEATTDVAEGVADADIVVVCTPVDSISDFVIRASRSAPSGVLITDGGSTKSRIVRQVESQIGGRPVFIGSHPMAGSEKTGAEFSDEDLYVDRDVIVTPTDDTDPNRLEKCKSFWESLGARVLTMSPELHDAAVSSISHLPHVISALLAGATPSEHLSLASTGWLDTTRIAGGDVEMWQQIIQHNRDSIANSVTSFRDSLDAFKNALDSDDMDSVRRLLQEGKNKRDAVAS